MNKYIENLTVKEYEEIREFLKTLLPQELEKAKETNNTKKYVELRFILMKIDKIINKYKKNK